MTKSLTPDEWLSTLGEHVRAHRLAFEGGTTREDLARLAGVSVSALANLETGAGASLATFVKVLRALGKAAWLDTLQPSPVINPLHMHLSGSQRVRAPRKPRKDSPA